MKDLPAMAFTAVEIADYISMMMGRIIGLRLVWE